MPTLVSLRLQGYQENLHPGSFIQAVKNLWGILRDLDAAISKDPRGTVEWDIHALSRSSPALIQFSGKSLLTGPDYSEEIQTECITGLRLLTEKGERLPSYSDSAINRALHMAKLNKRRPHERLSLIEVSNEHGIPARLNEATVTHIESLMVTRYESEGSVVGSLDTITVHKGREFRVWEEVANRAVTCKFPEEMLNDVKSALGKRVVVYGLLNANYQGQPTSIRVKGFEGYPSESDLPTIREMSGLVEDFTSGQTLKKYIEEVRNG